MAAVEELSLEETNKIRISLGLKPLTDDKAPPADKEKEAEQNYARVRQQAGKERADRCFPVLLFNSYELMRTSIVLAGRFVTKLQSEYALLTPTRMQISPTLLFLEARGWQGSRLFGIC